MKSSIEQSLEHGFTLIEVLVALAVAAGALVLIFSANGASLRRSQRARLDEKILRLAESQLAQWRIGADEATEGALVGFDRYRWEIRSHSERLDGIPGLRRATLTVLDPDGGRVLVISELIPRSGGSP